MELSATSKEGGTIVSPTGRIDHASADQFALSLAPYLARCNADEPPLVIDMSGVDYISSVGLRALMMASKQAESQHGRIFMAALTPMVREVFEISGFDKVFNVYDNVDNALAASAGTSG